MTRWEKIDTFCKKHYAFAWGWFAADLLVDFIIKPLWKAFS